MTTYIRVKGKTYYLNKISSNYSEIKKAIKYIKQKKKRYLLTKQGNLYFLWVNNLWGGYY